MTDQNKATLPIERIRAEVEEVQRRNPGCPAQPGAEGECCKQRQFAEDKLKLAEAGARLVQVASEDKPEEWAEAVYAIGKVLAEVAR